MSKKQKILNTVKFVFTLIGVASKTLCKRKMPDNFNEP